MSPCHVKSYLNSISRFVFRNIWFNTPKITSQPKVIWKTLKMRNTKVMFVVAVTVISILPHPSVCQNLRFPPQDGRTFDILGSLSNLRSNILSIFGNTFNNNNNQPIRRPVRPGSFSAPPPPPPSRPEPPRQPPPPPLPPAPLPFSSGRDRNETTHL